VTFVKKVYARRCADDLGVERSVRIAAIRAINGEGNRRST